MPNLQVADRIFKSSTTPFRGASTFAQVKGSYRSEPLINRHDNLKIRHRRRPQSGPHGHPCADTTLTDVQEPSPTSPVPSTPHASTVTPSSSFTPHRPVVAAAILDSLDAPTALLCAARAYPADLRGLFELPGGKIEEGEEPLEALSREIAEELGTTLIFGTEVSAPDGGWWPILQGRHMGVWLAEVAPTFPAPCAGRSHRELRWVPLGDVAELHWIGNDLEIAVAAASAAAEIATSTASGTTTHTAPSTAPRATDAPPA